MLLPWKQDPKPPAAGQIAAHQSLFLRSHVVGESDGPGVGDLVAVGRSVGTSDGWMEDGAGTGTSVGGVGDLVAVGRSVGTSYGWIEDGAGTGCTLGSGNREPRRIE